MQLLPLNQLCLIKIITMKKTFTLITGILISIIAFTQPEISQSNMPLIGDDVTISICSDQLDPGEAGAMQNWDMSDLTEAEEQFFSYFHPSEGLMADSFPEANLCAMTWEGQYSYYNVSSSSLSVEGYVVPIDPGDTSTVIMDDKEQVVSLPFGFEDTFTDSFDGSSWVPGFGEVPFDGSVNFEADGYGTLVLPNGTYENVVRYHATREQTNYVNGFPTLTISKEQWIWVSEEYRFWLLLMEENFDGFNTSTLIWYNKNPHPASTGIAAHADMENLVYPNPLRSGQQLTIQWNGFEKARVSVLSLDGSVVREDHISLTEGNNFLRTGDLDSGLYIIKIETDNRILTRQLSVIN